MGASGLMAVGPPTTIPGWLLPVKALIILFSVIVLVLAAFGRSHVLSYSTAVSGFLIFLAILTCIIYGGSVALEHKAVQLYYRFLLFIAYIFSCILWLTAWLWAASWARAIFASSEIGPDVAFGAAMAGSAVVGAFTWLLCVIDLVVFARSSIRDNSSAGIIELSQAQKQHGIPTS